MYLLSRHCPEVKHWLENTRLRPYHVSYLSPKSQNEFIDIVAKEVRNKVISDVKQAGMFSVMADTTPDVSHKDRLALACRYVNKSGEPTERLISLGEAKDKRGEGGATEIIETLLKHGTSTDNLCFQSYDYTAAMSGKFNGVQRKLQDKLGKSVPYIPCLAHRTNTAVEHSCNASPIMKELFNVLEEVYVFFTSSTKRSGSLDECIKEFALDNTLQLRNLSKTRWTARAESIRAVWSSYDAIRKSLEDLEKSGDVKTKTSATGLLMKISRLDFITAIMFGKNVMTKTQRLAECLQSEELNVVDALAIMSGTVESLKQLNSNTEGLNGEIESAVKFATNRGLDPTSDFQRYHRRRRPPARLDDNAETSASLDLLTFYRKEFKAVLDTQISFLSDVQSNCTATIKPLVDCLSFEAAESPTAEDFHALASFFPESLRPDPMTLMGEIDVFKAFAKTSHTDRDFADMREVGKFAEDNRSAFPLTARAYRLALTAPVTVAKGERTFSKLKLVKTLNRSKMLDERLENLMLMACEKDITDEIKVEKFALTWATLKQRRILISSK